MKPYDVVIAGGGNAGLCAALNAAAEGARVLLVERSPRWRRGGNSRHTRDIRYAHDSADPWAVTPYPSAAFADDLQSVSDPGSEHSELAGLMIEESRSLPTWMEQQGVRWQQPLRGSLALSTNRFFLGGGKALMNTYYDAATRRGVDVMYAGSVVGVELADDGGARALRVEYDGERQTVRAGAVILASGGLEANRDWLRTTLGEGAANFVVRGTPDNDGSLLLTLLDNGAQSVGNPETFHGIAVDARSPRADGGIITRVDSIPFGIVVDQAGRRFYDEGEAAWPKRYAQWGQLIARRPGQMAYSIMDSQSWGQFIPSCYPPLRAGTLPELAGKLGLDAAAVSQTVAEFNAAATPTGPFDPSRLDGNATIGLAPPKSNWARPIERAPYYGYPLRPGITFTYAGLAVDARARVLRTGGEPFGNVFAAGELMAGNILTRGYLAGVGLTIGSVFGRIAGREAARV
jgi:tricarballylate dehydrogenase